MSGQKKTPPTIAVLTAEGEEPPPGLAPLQGEARLLHAADDEGLAAALEQADVLLVTDFRTELLARVWPRARRLQWVHATMQGVDALMFPALVDSDIPVTNAKGIFDGPIAEYVLGAVILFAKDFLGSFHLQAERRWRHRDTERVAGRNVLIVGAGGIGRATARLLRAAGMAVEGIATRERDDDPDFGRVHAQDALFARLPQADFVVLATPLTPRTRHMFGREAFRRMAPHARLINVGRGPVVDTDALVDALRAGEIAGAVLDVFEEEPLPPEHPLWAMPQVLITAHMSGDVIGWREALSRQFIDNFRRWRNGEPLFNIVDKRRGYVPGGGAAS